MHAVLEILCRAIKKACSYINVTPTLSRQLANFISK